jgi:prepilin-type N-terminal cleavage/methylation domain-containing protein
MNKKRLQKTSGFTIIELMIVIAVLVFFIAAVYNTFLTGQSLWSKVDRSIELDDNIRKVFDRIAPELAMSGHDSRGFFQVAISDNGGINGSDILRFSLPVICQTNGNPVDAQGNAAHWGAPLTWGCTDSSCMDRDNNCDTIEYKYIEYLIGADSSLVRRVLDYSQAVVREDVIAMTISDFQAETNYNQRVLSLTVTARLNLIGETKITESSQMDIYLRNSR